MFQKIYNSLTKQKEQFKPLDPAGKEVRMYVCGPTVYDEPHIGHLRSACVFDMIRRYLEYSGRRVTFVRNVTDVDDKIIAKAAESGPADLLTEVRQVSDMYLALYKNDLGLLGVQEPTVEPKATAHIREMQDLIQKLIERNKAYVSDGDVYFSVTAAVGYGKLSHQNKDAILQNVRIEKNEKKRDVLDFALWKKAKDGEPSWPSPWGAGRPGWHIECSAMSMKYLGETFDIHGGGRDLIFPHHENEAAQSESATGKPFARYWIHHGLITVNEQKMSKSLKNFITLGEIRQDHKFFGEELLKLLFLGTHYSAPLDYTEEKMKTQLAVLNKFRYFFEEADRARRLGVGPAADDRIAKLESGFIGAMNDDFNTPLAMSVLFEMIKTARLSQDPRVICFAAGRIKDLTQRIFNIFSFADAFIAMQPFLSLNDEEPLILEFIEKRKQARQNKDFKTADQIRTDLKSRFNIELVDYKDGSTNWRNVE